MRTMISYYGAPIGNKTPRTLRNEKTMGTIERWFNIEQPKLKKEHPEYFLPGNKLNRAAPVKNKTHQPSNSFLTNLAIKYLRNKDFVVINRAEIAMDKETFKLTCSFLSHIKRFCIGAIL